jgi:hypothetical protein
VGGSAATAGALERGAEDSAFRRRWTWRTRLFVALTAWALALVLRLLYLTLRVELVDPADVLGRRRRGERMLVAFWHEGVPLVPLLVARLGWPDRPVVLLSWHSDGEIAARALRRLGIDSVRGSSTRGWVGGLRGLLQSHARGRDLVIVPDGPRGPRRRAKEGVVQVARATGLSVVTVGAAAWPARRLRKSWDRMQLPRPFSRVALVMSEPLKVARRADAATMRAAHSAVVAALERGTVLAEAAVGAPPE